MKNKNLFWGLFFILAAVLIIVNNLGYFEEISVFKVTVTIILIAVLLKSIRYLSYWGILFPIAFLCIIYAKQWNITALTPGPVLLTALLGSIGLSILFKKNKYWCHDHKEDRKSVV